MPLRHIWIAITVLLIDQITKMLAVSASPELADRLISIYYQANRGVIGGFLSGSSPVIGRIFFSVLGIFIVILGALCLYLLKHKDTPRLKKGAVLFASGILGNIIDRAFRGEVVDFIALRFSTESMLVVNIADFAAAAGFLLLIVSLFSEYEKIWFENDARKNLLIDRPFQFQYTGLLIFFALTQAAVIVVYSFSFLSVYLGSDISPANVGEIIRDYLVGISILEACFIALSIALGVLFSHRAAGPVYSFEVFFEKWFARFKDNQPFDGIRLRKTDHFKVLEKISEKMSQINRK